MSYRDLVESERKEYIGRDVIYKGEPHKIVDVDWNGAILIDLKAQFTDTTALYRFDKDLTIFRGFQAANRRHTSKAVAVL